MPADDARQERARLAVERLRAMRGVLKLAPAETIRDLIYEGRRLIVADASIMLAFIMHDESEPYADAAVVARAREGGNVPGNFYGEIAHALLQANVAAVSIRCAAWPCFARSRVAIKRRNARPSSTRCNSPGSIA